MPTKLDFDLQPDGQVPFSGLKVGQAVHVKQSENSGSWACCTDEDRVLGDVPDAAASTLRSHTNYIAVVRSIKRSTEQPDTIGSIQVRVSLQPAGQQQQLVQAEPPADDPTGFTLTTTELERLAHDADLRTTLADKRLQQLLVNIDGAPNREQALKQALETPSFRDVADRALKIMKPEHSAKVL